MKISIIYPNQKFFDPILVFITIYLKYSSQSNSALFSSIIQILAIPCSFCSHPFHPLLLHYNISTFSIPFLSRLLLLPFFHPFFLLSILACSLKSVVPSLNHFLDHPFVFCEVDGTWGHSSGSGLGIRSLDRVDRTMDLGS